MSEPEETKELLEALTDFALVPPTDEELLMLSELTIAQMVDESDLTADQRKLIDKTCFHYQSVAELLAKIAAVRERLT